jgi:hypothetical protein
MQWEAPSGRGLARFFSGRRGVPPAMSGGDGRDARAPWPRAMLSTKLWVAFGACAWLASIGRVTHLLRSQENSASTLPRV